jgi:hypothetical protein
VPYYGESHRYLNTSTGRCWSMDTDEGDDSDSLSLHKYLYSSADPVNRIDPTGNDDIAELSSSFGVSATINSMSTLNPRQVALDAFPIPEHPASPTGKTACRYRLCGIQYQGNGRRIPRRKN